MVSPLHKWTGLMAGAALITAALGSSPAQAADPSKTKGGVTYLAISANPSDGAEVIDYDNDPGRTTVTVRDHVDFDGERYPVVRIANNAFEAAPFTHVTISNSVRRIGSSAFEDSGLTSVTLGTRVQEIGFSAFWNTDLRKVVLPASVDDIASAAFGSNENLADIRFLGPVPSSIDNDAGYFYNSLGDPEVLTITYLSRFDSTKVAGGWTRPTWFGFKSMVTPDVIVTAADRVHDNSEVRIKVKVRAGTKQISKGRVTLTFAGTTKTFDISAPFSERTFRTPNVSGSGKTFTATAKFEGSPTKALRKGKGTKKIKVVE